jgi:sugar phosphate permease
MAATANVTIQMNVPDELRGRVLSVYTTTFAASSPLGGLLIGSIASTAGVLTALVFAGVASTVVGAAALAWIRRLRRRGQTHGVHPHLPADLPGGAMAPLRRR